jgi:heme/copper-type cytochrome/quinol oxidase subunit 2
MQPWILFAIIIGALVVVGVGVVLFVLVRNVRAAQDPATQGKYPQGQWMGIGMLIGLALGFIPSLAGSSLTKCRHLSPLVQRLDAGWALLSVLPWSRNTRTRFAH